MPADSRPKHEVGIRRGGSRPAAGPGEVGQVDVELPEDRADQSWRDDGVARVMAQREEAAAVRSRKGNGWAGGRWSLVRPMLGYSQGMPSKSRLYQALPGGGARENSTSMSSGRRTRSMPSMPKGHSQLRCRSPPAETRTF